MFVQVAIWERFLADVALLLSCLLLIWLVHLIIVHLLHCSLLLIWVLILPLGFLGISLLGLTFISFSFRSFKGRAIVHLKAHLPNVGPARHVETNTIANTTVELKAETALMCDQYNSTIMRGTVNTRKENRVVKRVTGDTAASDSKPLSRKKQK